MKKEKPSVGAAVAPLAEPLIPSSVIFVHAHGIRHRVEIYGANSAEVGSRILLGLSKCPADHHWPAQPPGENLGLK